MRNLTEAHGGLYDPLGGQELVGVLQSIAQARLEEKRLLGVAQISDQLFLESIGMSELADADPAAMDAGQLTRLGTLSLGHYLSQKDAANARERFHQLETRAVRAIVGGYVGREVVVRALRPDEAPIIESEWRGKTGDYVQGRRLASAAGKIEPDAALIASDCGGYQLTLTRKPTLRRNATRYAVPVIDGRTGEPQVEITIKVC